MLIAMKEKNIKTVYFLEPGPMAHYMAMLANSISKHINVVIIGQIGTKLNYINDDIEIRNVLKFPIGWSITKLILFRNIFIIDSIKPDIIHITTPFPIINALTRVFFSHRYSVVVTVHDPKPHSGEINNTWRSLFVDFCQYFLIKKADKLIVHGERLKNELMERKIPSKRITVIPHGDYSFFAKHRKDIPSEKNTILFFGRIIQYKGLEYLIKAVTIIKKEIPDIKLIIAGQGEFAEYQKLINNSPGNNFEIHNEYIPDENVAEFFERAQLLVLPYIEATQSGPLHIACAFKKPVIATSVGALPEVIEYGETGLIIPPKDVNALAEAIIKLLKDDELRKKMGEKSYIKMKEEMSWDKIAEKTIEVYKEAIELHYGAQK